MPTFGKPQSINSYELHDLFTTLPYFLPRFAKRPSIYHRMRHISHMHEPTSVDSAICQRWSAYRSGDEVSRPVEIASNYAFCALGASSYFHAAGVNSEMINSIRSTMRLRLPMVYFKKRWKHGKSLLGALGLALLLGKKGVKICKF